MKWLKKFNENIEEKLYWEIDSDEWERDAHLADTSKTKEVFTKQEKSFIIQMSKEEGYELEMADTVKYGGHNISEPEKWDYFFTLRKYSGDDPFLQCYKCEDEWFYITYSQVYWESDYYKCDGWEGVLQFLKDKSICK